MRVKVCGMTQEEQVNELNDLGVEFCGFIFYSKSPRYAYKGLTPQAIKSIKGNINKVGVFVNATEDEILKTVDDCGLYLVQLHGDETPRACEKISSYITTVKAFRVNETSNIAWKIKDYIDVVDMFLFDTAGSQYGGNGTKFNWQLLEGIGIDKPFFLSGGIGLEDVEELHKFSSLNVGKNLFCVDINSKFEISSGVKDIKTIKNFVIALKQGG